MNRSFILPGPISGSMGFDHFGRRTVFHLQIIERSPTEGFRETGYWNSVSPNSLHLTITETERQKLIVQQIQGRTFRVVSR